MKIGSPGTARRVGQVAAVGGVLVVASGVLMALRPEGSFEPGGPHRQASDLLTLMLVGEVLAVPALVVLALRAGRLGRLSLGAVLLGVGLLGLSGLVTSLVGGFEAVPLLVIPGGLLVVLATLLVGVATYRAGSPSRWVGPVIVVGTLLLFGFNTENWQALFLVPYGLAWIAVGLALDRTA